MNFPFICNSRRRILSEPALAPKRRTGWRACLYKDPNKPRNVAAMRGAHF